MLSSPLSSSKHQSQLLSSVSDWNRESREDMRLLVALYHVVNLDLMTLSRTVKMEGSIILRNIYNKN